MCLFVVDVCVATTSPNPPPPPISDPSWTWRSSDVISGFMPRCDPLYVKALSLFEVRYVNTSQSGVVNTARWPRQRPLKRLHASLALGNNIWHQRGPKLLLEVRWEEPETHVRLRTIFAFVCEENTFFHWPDVIDMTLFPGSCLVWFRLIDNIWITFFDHALECFVSSDMF